MPSSTTTLRTLFQAALLASALGLAACSPSEVSKFAPNIGKDLPAKLLADMKAKGMERQSPIMARIFKEEGKVEIWKQKTNGRYDMLASYDICKWSGKLGPKFIEGDRQAPEGFYSVKPSQMNPNSKYHLSFNIGFPNAYDRAHGRTGQNLMVHGACSSSGCYSMTDPQVEQIYALGLDAFKGGQTEFQIQAFPFRMTAANMARYKDDPNTEFWKNLKEGYDAFEITKVPPAVNVCEKRYVFNAVPEGGASFAPSAKCPAFSQPDALKTAYQSYKSSYDAAFTSAIGSSKALPPKPTIGGIKEAELVADWSKRRARGERVTMEPPSLAANGSVIETTTQMGRIDSEAGRRMAAKDAADAEKKRVAEEKAEAKAAAALKDTTTVVPVQNPAKPDVSPDDAQTVAADQQGQQPGMLNKLRTRLGGLFGG